MISVRAIASMDRSFLLTTSVRIQSLLLKKPVDLVAQEVAGRKFFHCVKGSKQVQRLLCSFVCDGDANIAKTDIVEQLVVIKDTAFQNAFQSTKGGAMDDCMNGELGIIGTPTKAKRYNPLRLIKMPEFITIEAPSVHGVQGLPLCVLPTKPGQGIWIEVTHASIGYLCKVVDAQHVHDEIRRVHPRELVPEDSRVSVDTVGVSYSYAQKRFIGIQNAGGVKARRFFAPSEDAEGVPPDAINFVRCTASSDDPDVD